MVGHEKVKVQMRLGFHMSIAGGLYKAAEEAGRIGSDCLQIFAANPRGWNRAELTDQAAERFRQEVAEHRLTPVSVHASYLINLASPKDELWDKSVDLLADELRRAGALGADGVVVHPGSRQDMGLDWGLERVAAGAARALAAADSQAELWLENTAGGRGQIGGTLTQLRLLLERLAGRPVGVCIDTAHAWAAGYGLRQARPVGRFLDRLEQAVGMGAVKLWHFNDMAYPRASRRDRHAHLGKGHIGAEGFRALAADPRLASAAVVMETPKDSPWADRRNLAFMRRLSPCPAPTRQVDTNPCV